MYSRKELADDFRRLGVAAGDTVMVHASVRAVGDAGHESPLERFVQREGKILLLGCDHDTVTFLHYAEHIVDIPGKRVARFKVPVLQDGRRVWRDMVEVDTSDAGAHGNWPDRFFARLVDTYLKRTNNRGAHVGNARSFLMDSRGLLALALEMMRAVAVDPAAAAALEP
jgi:aminoglycoside 3-N-acetyltransferase